MQGINQPKHQHLVDALLHLKEILRKRISQDGPVFLPLVENIRLAYGS